MGRAADGARGPKGGKFTAAAATPGGTARAEALWRKAGQLRQRARWDTLRSAELAHDVAVCQASRAAETRVPYVEFDRRRTVRAGRGRPVLDRDGRLQIEPRWCRCWRWD